MARTIAVYGGSFDPPTIAHQLAATWVLTRSGAERLLVVPTFAHPFGKPLAPFDARLRMLEAALGHLGGLVTIDPVERDLGGTSFTLRTLEAVRAREPDARLLLVLGTDAWAERARWHRFDDVLRLATPCLLGRDGVPDPEGADVPVHLPAVSSTDARDRLARGLPVRHLVPEPVLRIIEAEGLYGAR
jgi:nicotinate-nucleotide adenylyltransferase